MPDMNGLRLLLTKTEYNILHKADSADIRRHTSGQRKYCTVQG